MNSPESKTTETFNQPRIDGAWIVFPKRTEPKRGVIYHRECNDEDLIMTTARWLSLPIYYVRDHDGRI